MLFYTVQHIAKLVDVRHSIAVQRQAVVELTRRLQKLSDVGEKQKEYQAKKQDAEFRLKVFKQHGVEEKLQKQVMFEQDARAVKDLSDFMAKYGYMYALAQLVLLICCAACTRAGLSSST